MKQESDDQVIAFFQQTFKAQVPTGSDTSFSRPSFLVYDKAASVLARLIDIGKWQGDNWAETTRLLVDRFHFPNTDELGKEWCNPTPNDDSQPDLVKMDRNGDPIPLWNTSAAEELNSWLAGFGNSASKMRVENFDFFIHALLWFHGTRRDKRPSMSKKVSYNVTKTGDEIAESSEEDGNESWDDLR
ncbi:hypothetical protein T439DRAFT_58407 [Meredithblackwellia eburnea MCA 4105]